jgi:hypothetical protein
MTQYKNICTKLKDGGMKMLTSEDEFRKEKKFSYQCIQNHEYMLTIQSFINKTSPKKMDTCKSLCKHRN